MKERPQNEQPRLDDLISLRDASRLSGLSPGHLRLLVSQGVMWGRKVGRNWLTTAQAINEYLGQHHKPGPKPKNKK
jgi:hypothetical protein